MFHSWGLRLGGFQGRKGKGRDLGILQVWNRDMVWNRRPKISLFTRFITTTFFSHALISTSHALRQASHVGCTRHAPS